MEESQEKIDERFMRLAIQQAQDAFDKDEVPVGAILVSKGQVIARSHNLSEALTDATAHAEMQAVTMGSSYMGAKFLEECSLYVTLEPCTMCAGALYWTRVKEVIYGASDPKRGYTRLNENILHPKTVIRSGVLGEECGALLSNFFEKKRNL